MCYFNKWKEVSYEIIYNSMLEEYCKAIDGKYYIPDVPGFLD